MKNVLLNAVIFVICVVLYSQWKENPDINFATTVVGGFVVANLWQILNDNWIYLEFLPRLILIRLQQKPMRISFASLIRIKIGDKYFLVKSRRFTDLWQPAGGVYKYFDPDVRRRYGLQDDISTLKPAVENELRLSLPNKNVLNAFQLMKWFDSRLGREISPDREFREELIDTKILDEAKFREVHFQFIERNFVLQLGQKFQVWELMAFEVFELKLTIEQEQMLKKLISVNHKDLINLAHGEIVNNGFVRDGHDYRIGTQTQFIL